MHTITPKQIVATTIALAALCGLSIASADAASRLALVIGNDAYIPEFRLPSCVNDARSMAKWLESVGYDTSEIHALTDATREQMLAALEDLAQKAEAQRPEQVFFYYSGHGIAIADDDGDEGDGDGLDEAFVAIDKPAGSFDNVVVRDDQFYGFVERIAKASGQVFIVLDCCFSGGLAKSLPKDLERFKGSIAKAKFIHAQEMADYLAGKPQAKALKVPETRSKSLEPAAALPREINSIGAKRGVVFLSASNQFQLSRAGDSLSAFTEAFLQTVEKDRDRLTAAHGAFTLSLLRSELARKLYDVPQSPVLECQPKDLALDKDPFIPGLFPTPAKWQAEKSATSIVTELLALPADRREDAWKLQVSPTHEPPLSIGQKFALQVKSNAKGYLVMFTVGASGQVTFLYPNRYRLLNEVQADGGALLPYKDGLQVQPPVGTETFYVFLLERNPFNSFDFGKTTGAMAAGDLEGVLRQHPALRSKVARVAPEELEGTRSRGMIVERVSDALRAESDELQLFPSGAPRWTSAVIQIQTQE